MSDHFLAAIDGGGTKTEFVLLKSDGFVCKRLLLGASNPFDIGYDACAAILRQGLDSLLDGVRSDTVGIFAGLSGGASGDSGVRLSKMLNDLLPDSNCAADSDMVNAIASGSLTGEGCAVIAGTGSSCFARGSGKMVRCGGWGYLFDGAGSGYDLGAGAISYTLSVADGRAEASPLSELTEKALGGSPTVLLTDIYAKGKRYIASLAPVVFEACDAGDPEAIRLIDKTATYLAEIIRTACSRAGLSETAVVCVGGLWHRRDLLEPRILPRLPKGITLQYPDLPPIFGAATEAARLAGVPVTEDFRRGFAESYKF